MKKNYSTPVAEKIEFDYTESVLASGALKYTRSLGLLKGSEFSFSKSLIFYSISQVNNLN